MIKTIGNMMNPENVHLRKTLLWWFIILICGTFLGFLMARVFPGKPDDAHVDSASWFIAIMVMAFICEFIDSTLGMGYGTTLTPLLLLFHFNNALQVVPSVLFTELVTGVTSGFLHHRIGNVDFKKGSIHRKVAKVLTICSILGTFVAVLLAVYLANLNKNVLTIYIGVLVLIIGIVILVTLKRTFKFSWRRVVALGTIASFNKGMSGGGYGPLVTGGQIVSGVEGRSAVGITSLAEGLTCLVGVILYISIPYIKWSLLTKGIEVPWLGWKMPDGAVPFWHDQIDFGLAAPLIIGSVLSTPFAAWCVKRIQQDKFKLIIGIATVTLGIFTLIKVWTSWQLPV